MLRALSKIFGRETELPFADSLSTWWQESFWVRLQAGAQSIHRCPTGTAEAQTLAIYPRLSAGSCRKWGTQAGNWSPFGLFVFQEMGLWTIPNAFSSWAVVFITLKRANCDFSSFVMFVLEFILRLWDFNSKLKCRPSRRSCVRFHNFLKIWGKIISEPG